MKIEMIDRLCYAEKLEQFDFFARDQPWNRDGAHHISVARYKGRDVVAVDGWVYDFYIHKLIYRICKLGRKLGGLLC